MYAITRPTIRPRPSDCSAPCRTRSRRSTRSFRRSIGEGAMPDGKSSGDVQPGLLTEYLTEDTGFFVRSAREFEHFKSPFQAVEVHDTVAFGTLFRLDGHFMTSEKDEFFYHENLVHTGAIAHPAAATAARRRSCSSTRR